VKKKFIILFVIICVNSWLLSTVIEIKQDGTGDFLTIQEGINASVNNDTILVYPGIYFENLMIENKSITLASLYLTTEDENYINSTLIDGNNVNSVIRIENLELENINIIGVTIQNGAGYLTNSFGTRGGGIYSDNVNLLIKRCQIKNNKAVEGGGLKLINSQTILIGNTIKNNHAIKYGGAICISMNSVVTFDQNNRNNIYLNYAGLGSDIFKAYNCPIHEVILDTFTVIDPDQYYLFASDNGGHYVPGEITYDILNGKIEQINADIYVNPDGNDENSGLSPQEPLQNISYALALVRSDTLSHNTIYLADGIYSPSINSQYFPLQPKNAVSIIGDSMENTILDVEDDHIYHIYGRDKKNNYKIKNLKLVNSQDFDSIFNPIFLASHKEVLLENLYISDCNFSTIHDIVYIIESNFTMRNCKIINNNANGALSIWADLYSNHCIIENCLIKNNTQADHPDIFTGGGIHITKSHYLDPFRIDIINTDITENTDNNVTWPLSCSALSISNNVNYGSHIVNLVNCSIGDNFTTGPTGGAVRLSEGVGMNIINSIIYDNYPMEILLDGDYGSNSISVSHSLIEDGEWGIVSFGDNFVDWQDGNIDENPEWDIDGEFPYALTSSSPCIDTGTLNLPEGIELPEYDLAGNPRIVGETVDMGAYEFQGTNINKELIINNERIDISVYPNPFSPNNRDHCTSIKFNLLTGCEVNLDIYNIKGQKVKSLMDAYASRGEYTCRWDGRDENGKQVSSGQYFCKLMVDEKVEAVRKMVVIRK